MEIKNISDNVCVKAPVHIQFLSGRLNAVADWHIIKQTTKLDIFRETHSGLNIK